MQAAGDLIGARGMGDVRTTRASWKEAHESLQRLAKERAGLDFEEGRWFLVALRSGAHLRLGVGTFWEYIERLFGYGARFTQEKLRVAEALEGLPLLSEDLRSGKTSFSAVKELTRVATPETEQAWLEVARGKTVREVEKLVSGQRPGSLPHDVPNAGAKRHVLRFEVSGETFATFQEALAKKRRESGGPLDDDAVLLAMARQVLGGAGDDGRSSYQVSLTVCEHCRKGWQHGRGELVEVSDEVVEMAECDAQHIGHVEDVHDAHVGAGRAKQTIPPSLRRKVLARDHQRCRAPGCRCATFVDVHHRKTRSEGGAHAPDNLITLRGAARHDLAH